MKTGVDNILVSVLMSVYNERAEYLDEAISSILNQTYENIEFIIVNDGCDETCSRLLDSYQTQDNRIKIIKNESNIGLTKSLNKGLRIAKGKYVARMDSDDSSLPDRIGKQVGYMEENQDIAVLGTEACDFDGNKLDVIFYAESFEATKVRMLFVNAGVYHPTAMIRSSFLREHNIRYDEAYRVSQDYRMWVDVMMAGGIIWTLREPLLKYRIHSGQITQKKQEIQQMYARKTQGVYLDYLLSNSYHDIEKSEIEDIKKEIESLSVLSRPATVRDSLCSIEKFLSIVPVDRKKAKQEILMRYFRRGIHLIRHGNGVSPYYFLNGFSLAILAPWNIRYAVDYFILKK